MHQRYLVIMLRILQSTFKSDIYLPCLLLLFYYLQLRLSVKIITGGCISISLQCTLQKLAQCKILLSTLIFNKETPINL